jgi:diguanylate cyclase (GGDEF)-like protein
MKGCDNPGLPPGIAKWSAGRLAGDPLHAMRVLKRWVRVVTYGAVCAEWPLYYLVLGYPVHNIASSWAFGMVVATVAIEFAFAQGYKLRKQGIYPAILALEVGANRDLKQACEAAVRMAAQLLRADQVLLALSVHRDAELTTMATHGISPEDVPLATPLPWCQRPVKQAMKQRRVIVTPASEGRTWLSGSAVRSQIIYVPLLSLDRFVGLLILVGQRRTADLNDITLLTTIGLTLGLTLDNLRHAANLREVATHDELTRLFNRRHFFEQLEKQLTAARRSTRPLALLTMDVDSLKLINDTYGHHVGDCVLANLGKLLARRVRAEDIPARIGGDEFAVLMPDTDERSALAAAARIEKALLTKPIYEAKGLALKLGVSCGVAGYPWSGESVAQIVQCADANMYQAKAARRARSQVAPVSGRATD